MTKIFMEENMTETYITKRGTTVIVNIPDRTPEQQAIRDKEIEQALISIYRRKNVRA
jgi:hypothetical protein